MLFQNLYCLKRTRQILLIPTLRVNIEAIVAYDMLYIIWNINGQKFFKLKLIIARSQWRQFVSFHTRVANIFLGILKLRVLYYI